MEFCGKNLTLASSQECKVDTAYMIFQCLFILYCVLVLPIYRKVFYKEPESQSWVHFQGHSIRWLVTFILVFFNVCEIAEGAISKAYSSAGGAHSYVPHLIGLAASLCSIIYYHFVETWNKPKFLLGLFAYWITVLSLKVAKVTLLHKVGLSIKHLRLDLTWDIIILYFILLLVEINVLLAQKYVFTKFPHFLTAPAELSETRYLHTYANFISKCTFWWMNSILWQGFKDPLEMSDLGSLPSAERSEKHYIYFSQVYEKERERAGARHQSPSLWRCYAKAFWPRMVVGGIFKLLNDLLGFVGPLAITGIVSYVYSVREGLLDVKSPNVYYITISDFISNGYVLAVLVFIAYLVKSTLLVAFTHVTLVEGLHLRAAIQGMIYDKVLVLNSWSMSGGEMTIGQITNHMSTDAFNLLMMMWVFHYAWSSPLQIAITIYLLYNTLGSSALIGAAMIVVLAPVQYFIARQLSVVQKSTLDKSDERLKLTNELLQGIKLLKLYAWEHMYSEQIETVRKGELRLLLKSAIYRSFTSFITQSAPILVTLVSFGVYASIEKENLTVARAFSALALFNLLNIPLILFPILVQTFVGATVSTRRIIKFLEAPEVTRYGLDAADERPFGADYTFENGSVKIIGPGDDTYSIQSAASKRRSQASLSEDQLMQMIKPSWVVVEVTNGRFAWDLETHEAILEDINLDIPEGKLTMIVGQVGCGKTSLLSALLGEMECLCGSVDWCREPRVAYAAQRPWLLNATLKENILFGHSFDHRWYKTVVDACALETDINLLPAGDQTEIGEKGINLSGGQKQRISVARAIYSKASVVILDDPLSALDAHVSKHLFQEGIMKLLVKKCKTVVLVTHQIQYLKEADQIIAMSDGTITQQGTLEEIAGKDERLVESWYKTVCGLRNIDEKECNVQRAVSFLRAKSQMPEHWSKKAHIKKLQRIYSVESSCGEEGPYSKRPSRMCLHRQVSRDPTVPPLTCDDAEDIPDTEIFEEDVMRRKVHFKDAVTVIGKEGIAEAEEKVLDTTEADTSRGKLVAAEEKKSGTVSLSVYGIYFAAWGIAVAVIALLLNIIRQCIEVGTHLFLASWSSADTALKEGLTDNATVVESDVDYYICGYIALSIAGIVMALICALIAEFAALKASKQIHQKMLDTIILAPMRFFDTTPLGRILNRFSSDTNMVDQRLAITIQQAAKTFLSVAAAIIVNCIATPWFILPAIPIIIIYYFVQKFFRASSRELQRLDSISKSPIFIHTSETLNGLTTIRSFGEQFRFKKQILKVIDQNNTAFMFVNCAQRWLGVRLDYLGTVIVLLSTICSLTAALSLNADPGLVGLAIAYALMLAGMLNWVIRMIADVEMQMSSVERIKYYSDIDVEEYVSKTGNVTPADDWPEHGEIIFKDISLRYDASLDPVVQNISITIKPGETVGVCGRTGSGKSSLVLGLFRIIDMFEGKIFVDDHDLAHVHLTVLRSRLSIIPQEPVLFAGTVRFNVDPEEKFSDEIIWKALDTVQLKEAVVALGGLDAIVTEGGENFSVGEKQLFCLGRVLLKKSKVLVMDEATASLDSETDAKVQQIIKEQFADSTVLIIAHRIATIMSADTVIVLDNGKIVEKGPPKKLLLNPLGEFTALFRADKAGTLKKKPISSKI